MANCCLPRTSWGYSIIIHTFLLTARLCCFLAQTEEPWNTQFSLWRLYPVSKQSVDIVVLSDIRYH